MKWWTVAVGVEICDHSVSFVRVETDDFAERERERVEKKDVVEPEYKLMNSFLISTLSPQKIAYLWNFQLLSASFFKIFNKKSSVSTLTNDTPWSHISTPTATVHHFMAPKTIQRDHSYP